MTPQDAQHELQKHGIADRTIRQVGETWLVGGDMDGVRIDTAAVELADAVKLVCVAAMGVYENNLEGHAKAFG